MGWKNRISGGDRYSRKKATTKVKPNTTASSSTTTASPTEPIRKPLWLFVNKERDFSNPECDRADFTGGMKWTKEIHYTLQAWDTTASKIFKADIRGNIAHYRPDKFWEIVYNIQLWKYKGDPNKADTNPAYTGFLYYKKNGLIAYRVSMWIVTGKNGKRYMKGFAENLADSRKEFGRKASQKSRPTPAVVEDAKTSLMKIKIMAAKEKQNGENTAFDDLPI